MKLFATSVSRSQRIALLTTILGVTAIAGYLTHQYSSAILDPTYLREWIGGFGYFAPLVFVLVQVLQVIIAPIPGHIMVLLGGYLFGPVWGTIYSMIGVTIGSGLTFLITKRYGRPFVERVLHENIVSRLDAFVSKAGAPGLLVFFAIPGTPDDAASFLAGLTKIRITTFLVVVVVGRLPAYVLTSFAGESFAAGRHFEAVVILGLIAGVSALAYWFRGDIKRRLVQE
ncbi:TVP38/TMEM64 family protein [Haloarchaeobius amylolyticus]|uniref:TVP38/TMEM64 family protein n=1 Tax=Haloarchaeobius amylolyticus TaxID=1198296 RepID=UPI00226F3380|nr:TVP38/TMEM64 family protein [Haloarchaeobius amylolyticus]